MKYLQRLAKSFVLALSALPIVSILIGVGYFLQNPFFNKEELNLIIQLSKILILAGNIIIKNIPLLFVVGVSNGMAKDKEGTSVISGLISWFIFQTILSQNIINAYNENIDIYFNSNNLLLGIASGIIAAICYNKFKNIKFNELFSFFSGKRFVFIATSLITILISIILIFILPYINAIFMIFANFIKYLGALGSGIYGFLNRLLIPTGLHHILNIVFWFDILGINDLSNFWTLEAANSQVGMYMTGFYPITMFGLPAVALAIYNNSDTLNKKRVSKLLLTATICSFFTGITETIEFSFIFISPWLYFAHCILTAVSMIICYILPVRAGFTFSSGFIDLLFSSNVPSAKNIYYIFFIGIIFAFLYYFIFNLLIKKFNIKLLDVNSLENKDKNIDKKSADFKHMAEIILNGLGGAENIKLIDNCITRLRIEIKDISKVNEMKIKECEIIGIFYPTPNNIHIVIGNNAQFVGEQLKKICNK